MRLGTTTLCPHCHRPLKLSASLGDLYSEGCPVKKCPHCLDLYIDRHCREQAFKPYRKIHYLFNVFCSFCWAILITPFSFPLVLKLFSAKYSFPALIGYFFIVLVLFWILHCWLDHKDAENSRKLWDESDARLRDKDYAKMLAMEGFRVPARYLPEGFKRPSPISRIFSKNKNISI